MEAIRVLILGDIVGRPGRRICRDNISAWREELNLDVVIVNGENASGGNGLSEKNAAELFESGIDLVTSGNHIWKQKDYPVMFEKFPMVIRPANYPDDLPGRGWAMLTLESGYSLAVLNLLGQVFMDPIDSPFRSAMQFVEEIRKHTCNIIVDFHAEATSERVAMGYLLDGQVSAVFGTHTHIASADGRILPGGTAYQTDLGMTGPREGVIGVSRDAILKKFLTGLPVRFDVAKGGTISSGAVITIDADTGRTVDYQRFERVFE